MELVVIEKENILKEFLTNYISENTRKAYHKDLMDFFSFANLQGFNLKHPIDIKLEHLITFRDCLQITMAPKTTNRKLTSIKALLDWCVVKQHIRINPASALKLPKANPTKPTIAFTDAEVNALLRAPDSSSFYGNLHKMILSSLLILGLRRSELTNIKIKDIFETRGHFVLQILGKGSKLREIPLNETILDLINTYKIKYTEKSGKTLESNDFLLQSQASRKNTKAITPSSIYQIVVRYAKKAGIKKEVSPHSCRATVLSHLLECGESPRNVADFAGHSDINTTISLYDKKRDNFENSSAYKVKYGE